MIWRIYDIVELATFMLFKLVLFLCLAQGYTKMEKEKLSEYGSQSYVNDDEAQPSVKYER